MSRHDEGEVRERTSRLWQDKIIKKKCEEEKKTFLGVQGLHNNLDKVFFKQLINHIVFTFFLSLSTSPLPREMLKKNCQKKYKENETHKDCIIYSRPAFFVFFSPSDSFEYGIRLLSFSFDIAPSKFVLKTTPAPE